MKFLLSYNMKIVVLWEDKNLVGGAFFQVEEEYWMLVKIIEFKFLLLKTRNVVNV